MMSCSATWNPVQCLVASHPLVTEKPVGQFNLTLTHQSANDELLISTVLLLDTATMEPCMALDTGLL